MSNTQNVPAATTEAGITQATLDQAVATARAEGVSQGEQNGRRAERERINSILTHEAAANKRETAMALALETELPVDQAVAVLGKSSAGGLGLSPEATNGPEIGGGNTPAPKGSNIKDRLKAAQEAQNKRVRAA